MFSEKIDSIAKYSMCILFTHEKREIERLRKSLIDLECALLNELSVLNTKIEQCIKFNSKAICTEYIDYLIDEIEKNINKTMTSDSAISLVKFSEEISKRIGFCSNEKISNGLVDIKSKVQSLIKHDIKKSISLNSISKSKTYDFIKLTRKQLISISDASNELILQIKEIDLLTESCTFCHYYISKSLTDDKSYMEILEENYDVIISRLSEEYMKWSEMNNGSFS